MQQNDRVKAEKAILVGLSADCFRPEENATDESLDELEALAQTAGAQTAAKLVQKRPSCDPATVIGSGRLEELARLCENDGADLVILRARARRSLYLTTTSRRPRSARWRS